MHLSKGSRFAQCLEEECGETEERDVAGARNIRVFMEFFRQNGVRPVYLCLPGFIHSLSGVADNRY
jgi:hypothetical protein